MPLPSIIKIFDKGAVTYEDPYTRKPGVSIELNRFFKNQTQTIAECLRDVKYALEEVDTWPEGQKSPSDLVDEVAGHVELEMLYLNIFKDTEEYHLIIAPVSEGKLQWFPDRAIGETYVMPRQKWFLRLVITKK